VAFSGAKTRRPQALPRAAALRVAGCHSAALPPLRHRPPPGRARWSGTARGSGCRHRAALHGVRFAHLVEAERPRRALVVEARAAALRAALRLPSVAIAATRLRGRFSRTTDRDRPQTPTRTHRPAPDPEPDADASRGSAPAGGHTPARLSPSAPGARAAPAKPSRRLLAVADKTAYAYAYGFGGSGSALLPEAGRKWGFGKAMRMFREARPAPTVHADARPRRPRYTARHEARAADVAQDDDHGEDRTGCAVRGRGAGAGAPTRPGDTRTRGKGRAQVGGKGLPNIGRQTAGDAARRRETHADAKRRAIHGGPPPGPALSLSAAGATLFRRNRSAVLAVRSPGEQTPHRLRRARLGAGAVAPARPGEGGDAPRRRQRYLPGPLCQKKQPTVFHFPRCATLSGNPSLSLVDGRRRCRRTRHPGGAGDPHGRPRITTAEQSAHAPRDGRRSPGTGPASSLSARRRYAHPPRRSPVLAERSPRGRIPRRLRRARSGRWRFAPSRPGPHATRYAPACLKKVESG
jgi:hypothetical protein